MPSRKFPLTSAFLSTPLLRVLFFVLLFSCLFSISTITPLQVFCEISSPSNSLNSDIKWSYDVVAQGNYVYLAGYYNGLLIYDISSPSEPILVGQFNDDDGLAQSVHVDGSFVYVADHERFEIIDVSNPSEPFEIYEIAFTYSGSAMDVAVEGPFAYVAAQAAGLLIVNVSDPYNPVQYGRYDDGSLPENIVVVGSYAYINDNESGLKILDVSNPVNPIFISELYDGGQSNELVALCNSYVFVADGWQGIEIIDVSDPANPVEIGQYSDGGGWTHGVYACESYVYMPASSPDDSLKILNISDMEHPTKVMEFPLGCTAFDVYCQGQFAYVASSQGLRVLNISGFDAPNVVSPCSTFPAWTTTQALPTGTTTTSTTSSETTPGGSSNISSTSSSLTRPRLPFSSSWLFPWSILGLVVVVVAVLCYKRRLRD